MPVKRRSASPLPARPVSETHSVVRRSRVTNGKVLFHDGDGTSPWARRFRDLIELHASDLGPHENLTEAQLSLVRRVSTMEVELEQMEARLSKGDATVDLDLMNRLIGNLRRVLETLGIERKAKPRVIDPLHDHFSRPPERALA